MFQTLVHPTDFDEPSKEAFRVARSLAQALGIMGSLGHSKGFGKLLKVRLHGFPAWFIRRTYYLLQMPGWGRRLRIMIDWTFALLFRPDVVKISLDREEIESLKAVAAEPPEHSVLGT